MASLAGITPNNIEEHIDKIFPELHAKRILSLANVTLSVVSNASLAVAAIGKGLAHSRGLLDKHAIEQLDRLLRHRHRPECSVQALGALLCRKSKKH